MYLRRKEKGKSKIFSDGFCLLDSEAEQRALQFLHIFTQIQTVTPQLLNQINISRRAEL